MKKGQIINLSCVDYVDHVKLTQIEHRVVGRLSMEICSKVIKRRNKLLDSPINVPAHHGFACYVECGDTFIFTIPPRSLPNLVGTESSIFWQNSFVDKSFEQLVISACAYIQALETNGDNFIPRLPNIKMPESDKNRYYELLAVITYIRLNNKACKLFPCFRNRNSNQAIELSKTKFKECIPDIKFTYSQSIFEQLVNLSDSVLVELSESVLSEIEVFCHSLKDLANSKAEKMRSENKRRESSHQQLIAYLRSTPILECKAG
ncbi:MULTISPECIES: hypothetical protein [Vibrio]|uniref:hypothetical protein n=1 Tax=Vibrio TaxID=662 RepID=UPI00078B3CFA|nr:MULTISPECIES: hypothetical protein [Vibrio]BAU70942.1 hypothetical protein [Vibrio sp. 04Ya108]BBM67800.1 hypothetical protein VA249_44460 [Vibrio alfacsensis]BCN26971.1 hypothetical protein VYA_41630 [Vibrio alfacsensis]